ncbi:MULTISPECIES: hypothetical protein [unclassified Streptomyces]|uniref:hypothetical protein n=1 Tax=unclassified Streptomyces TaxID=2593676 RepID=UPI003866CB92
MSIPTPNVTLNNGVVMPHAIDCGYRSSDTATVHGNETGIGRAPASSGIPARNCSSPPNCGTRSPLHARRLPASEHLRTDWRPRAVSHQPRV